MNNITRFKHIILLATALTLTACGGGGSNGGSSGPTSLPTGTFTKTVELPGISSNWTLLFRNTNASGARYQSLTLASNLNGAGPVDSLSFRFSEDSTGNSCPNVTIRMGHSTMTDLNTTYANNIEQGSGSLVRVFNNTTLTIPSGSAGDYFTIPLNGAFNYNGVDNLVVDVSSGTCTGNSQLMGTQATTPYTALIWDVSDSVAVSGNAYDGLAHMRFTFAGGDNYLDSTVGTLGAGNTFPFNSNPAAGRKVQLLYPATDVNGSGPITGIGFPVGDLTTDQTYTVTVKLGHSTLSEFIAGPFADSYSDTPVTVGTDLTFTVPAGIPQGGFVWLPITETFNYNGTDNLILEVETTDNSLATGMARWWVRASTGTNNRLFGDLGVADGLASDTYYFTKFRFNGGTVDAGLSNITTISLILDGTADGAITQSLYRPVDLGTGGMIKSINVRLADDSVTATHSNYTIRIGHTDKVSLNPADTFASNMDEDMTAYSGSLTIPAGLKVGDWVTIPLDTPFSYDSTRNLVILFSSQGGALAGNDVTASIDPRYVNSIAASNAGSDAVPALGSDDGIVSIQLQIEP